jgi:hypothetical protein
MTDLRYPIGKFHFDGPLTEQQRQKALDDIADAPASLRAAVKACPRLNLIPRIVQADGPCARPRITCPTAI